MIPERAATAVRWLLVVLVLSSFWLPAPHAEAAIPPIDDRELLFGVAGHAWWLDEHLDPFIAAYRDLRVTSVRLSVDWKYIEPTPGSYRWDRYDRVLNRLADEGMTVVGVFVTVPAWASSNADSCAIEEREPADCDLLPQHRPAFDRVVRATLTRYSFIRYWEFWNEPELWQRLGRDVGDYLPLLQRFYAIAKEVDPDIRVAASTLAGWDYVGWLYSLASVTLGPNVRPWDAIAFHPYNTGQVLDADGNELTLRYADIERLRTEMVNQGDGHKPIWITEYGWHFEPRQQARALRTALGWMLRQPYIEMAHLHMLHDWEHEKFGLMRAVPEVYGVGAIEPETRFEPKEPYYSTFRDFARPRPPLASPGSSIGANGLRVAPIFSEVWRLRAGPGLGMPLTRAVWQRRTSGDAALVQYFERGRLEWTRSDGVATGLLGDEVLQARGWLDANGQPSDAATWPRTPVVGEHVQYFPETGHELRGAFLQTWNEAGGVATLGFPRTTVVREVTPDGGERFIQYTQRGRLEQRAAMDGSTHVVVARLGVEIAQQRGWLDSNERPTSDYLNPSRPEFRVGQ